MTNKKIAKERHASVKRSMRRLPLQMLAAAGLLFGAGLMQSCDKDILTGQPGWLGNSIYERLEEGITTNDGQARTFKYTLRLIDDLGYKETLSRTGSKTVFATPDDLYEQWFTKNNTSYDRLTLTQKKQLFNNSMINNAYLVDLMSNVSGNPPQEGYCLRRETATSVYDSIPVMKVADMPVNPMDDVNKDAWSIVREEGKDIRICKDATNAPMIHFLPAFMQQNNITDDDLALISNGESNSISDSWISGKKVISSEQTCKNGYVYVVDGVIEGAPNMAQQLHDIPNTKYWAAALDRFTCPVEVTGNMLSTYQANYKTEGKLYELRYFNNSTNREFLKGGSLEDKLNASGVLRIDPGWNQYSVTTPGQNMSYDAAVMIVPTDEAVEKWWNEGGGRDLKARFESWDKIDYETLVTLLNVNMQESFVGSVPSKFSSVLDYTSQRELGITKEHVKKCYMCCNGIIYLVDQVYSPDTYSSVLYPALLQTNGSYSVIYHALTGYYSGYSSAYDFSPYLSAMDSRFSLIIPYNTTVSENTTVATEGKVFRMIDPCTFGLPKLNVLEFYYSNGKVQGVSYEATEGSGGLSVNYTRRTTMPEDAVKNRIFDLIDNNIVIGDLDGSQLYYQTKTGGMIKAYKSNGMMHVDGGYQIENGETVIIPDSCIVDKGSEGNGVTYGVASEGARGNKIMDVPMTSAKSVYQILSERSESSKSECSLFFDLLKGSKTLLSNKEGSYDCAGNDNMNIKLFDSYNYTVYVPQNAAIQDMIDKGYLPTWADYDSYEKASESDDSEVKKEADSIRLVIRDRIEDFIRYHVQDKSVVIDGTPYSNELFETGKRNPETNRFYPVTVSADKSSISIMGQANQSPCNVVKNGGLYNILGREYWISNKGKTTSTAYSKIESSSYAVVHQIDGVLLYDKSQLTKWKVDAKARKSTHRK